MPEPGTTMACTLGATFLPLATDATARMSSMRPFVHEPMNTCTAAFSVDERQKTARWCQHVIGGYGRHAKGRVRE
eukprot:374241-Pleurochrysis_carterae.AAC.2